MVALYVVFVAALLHRFVTACAQSVTDNVKSMGVSLSVCSIPGQPLNARLAAANSYELGLGIHGEPGAKSGVIATRTHCTMFS